MTSEVMTKRVSVEDAARAVALVGLVAGFDESVILDRIETDRVRTEKRCTG
jgi:hypothetical protein